MPGFRPFIVCGVEVACEYPHLIELARNIIHNLVVFSTFIAVAVFAYVGFLLLTSGGSEDKKNQAKHAFKMVVIGYLWILTAWLLIYTITDVLLKDGYSILGNPQPTNVEISP